MRTAAVLSMLLAVACTRASKEAGADAAAVASAAPTTPSVADAGVADAGAADAARACKTVAWQPELCVEPRFKGFDAAPWLIAHGASKVSPKLAYMHCREAVLGSAQEQALECIDETTIALTGNREEGPIEDRADFVIVSVRKARPVELLRLPLYFTEVDGSYERLFTARYELDAAAGTLQFVAPADECTAARAALKPYWAARIERLMGMPDGSFRRQILAGWKLQRRSQTVRIDATCRAAGEYQLAAGGKFAKAP